VAEDGRKKLGRGLSRNLPGKNKRHDGRMERGLLRNEIAAWSRRMLATQTEFGRPIVMRFEDGRIRHPID
jgi:hypothetical protein